MSSIRTPRNTRGSRLLYGPPTESSHGAMTMNSKSLRSTLSTLAKSLEQRFSQPRKLYLQTLTGSRSLSADGKRVLWIVGRGLLKHEIFTIAGDLPPAKRRSVLELQIRRWSPFRASRWSVAWSEN